MLKLATILLLLIFYRSFCSELTDADSLIELANKHFEINTQIEVVKLQKYELEVKEWKK